MSVAALAKTCLLLLAGGLAAQHSTLLFSSDHYSLLLVASICALLIRRLRCVGTFVLAYAVFMMAATDVTGQWLQPQYAGDSMLARVRVADFPKVTGESVVMRIEPLGDHRLPPRVRVSWFKPPHVPAIGEIWELEVRLRRPRGMSNPGVFDYESWLFRERVHATGYVVGGSRNRLLWSGTQSRLDRFRQDFADRADAATQSDDATAVLPAIGVGLRHQLSREQWDNFAMTGTSHLMAISGLHVGLAAMAAFVLAFLLLGLLPGSWNTYTAALLAGAAIALAYAVVSGFGVPARRAVLMLAVAALTVTRRRQVVPGAAVALSAAVVFITDPIASLTPGFHLSFTAVVVLLWLARHKHFRAAGRRLWSRPKQLVVMQVFLLFGLLPFTAVIFQRFAIMATPVNFVAVPLFSVVTVPLTLLALAIGPFVDSLALALLRIAGHSIDWLAWFVGHIVRLPFADIRLARLEGAALLLLLLPPAWVFLPAGWPGRRVAVLGVAAILCWKPGSPPESCFDAWVLDVGQGLAVVLQTGEGVMLFDTGMAWRGGRSAAAQSVVPFLQSRKIARIDWLVVSHADIDHSGGLATVRESLEVGVLIAGEALPGERHVPCRIGQRWVSAQVVFEILHPAGVRSGEGNAASCVLRVSTGPYSLLLTGDIEAKSEQALVRRAARLESNIVVVPHHGSATSSIAAFAELVRPEFAIVSAGFANRWGFPRPEVVQRWRAAGAQVLDTATSGAVSFRVCGRDGVRTVIRERERRQRFWHAET